MINKILMIQSTCYCEVINIDSQRLRAGNLPPHIGRNINKWESIGIRDVLLWLTIAIEGLNYGVPALK